MEDTTIEDVLKTVETFYNQKDYQSALSTLEKNQSQISPGVWHYNMGTIYGKLENWPLARFHFLMAAEEGQSTKELVQNKELVETKLDVARLEKPLSTIDYLVKAGLIGSQGVFTTLSLLLIIAGLISLWKKNMKLLGASFVCAFLVLGLNFWIQTWNKVIVIQPQSIHEGPSAIFGAKEELPPGVMLVTTHEGEWLKVVYPTRFRGWIKDAGLKELK